MIENKDIIEHDADIEEGAERSRKDKDEEIKKKKQRQVCFILC